MTEKPVSQRDWLPKAPLLIKQLPRPLFSRKPNTDFKLVQDSRLKAVLQEYDPKISEAIRADLSILEAELLPKFQERDYEASFE